MSTPTSPSFSLDGHEGHLDAKQEEALKLFQSSLIASELYTPANESQKASHDVPTLLRFLRARRFDSIAAQKQFSGAAAWRQTHDVDNLYKNFDPAEFEESKRFYPRWIGRRDKQGLPVYVYRLASLDKSLQKELNKVPDMRRYQRIVSLYEYMTRFVMPLCSYLPHPTSPTSVSSVTTIIDLDSVSLTSMWSLRSHLQQASTLATANYPETLNTIAVVNAPSFFPTVWGWIKGWFDEGTRNKIHVLSRCTEPRTISELHRLIDPRDLPKPYGGDLEWKFEDEPNLDEDTKRTIEEVPKGPCLFVDGAVEKP